MNKMFDISNSRGHRGWVVAATPSRALELATIHRWGKPQNLTVVDVTSRYLTTEDEMSLKEILDKGEGVASIEIKTQTFADILGQLQSGKKKEPEPGKWRLSPF